MPIGPSPHCSRSQVAAWRVAIATWVALIALGLAWELFLAPLRPGGSWLALKIVPLLLPLPAMMRGGAYAMQLALFIILLTVLEAAVRLFEPASSFLAACQLLLAIAFFTAAIAYLRPMKLAAKRRARSA